MQFCLLNAQINLKKHTTVSQWKRVNSKSASFCLHAHCSVVVVVVVVVVRSFGTLSQFHRQF